MSALPQFSALIPASLDAAGLTWMLQVWRDFYPTGASIDTVARACVKLQEEVVLGAMSNWAREREYQRVYMLSVQLANFGLLFASAPGTPLVYRPTQPWYEAIEPEPAHFGETPTP